jgi:hypothetical protein
MIELILLQQADVDIQAAFDRYEHYQEGRGEVFMRHLDLAFTLLRQNLLSLYEAHQPPALGRAINRSPGVLPRNTLNTRK